jgi:Short C-terminal domain
MKSLCVSVLIGLVAAMLSGCVLGAGDKSYHQEVRPTLGQQLLDLKKAKDAGAINDAEYEAQKTKLLEKKSS